MTLTFRARRRFMTQPENTAPPQPELAPASPSGFGQDPSEEKGDAQKKTFMLSEADQATIRPFEFRA
jgi:hypothetical protein